VYRYRGDPKASVTITLDAEDGILFHVGNRGLPGVRRADGTPVDPAAEDSPPATIQLNETGEGIIVNDGGGRQPGWSGRLPLHWRHKAVR
jgi:hypothetical protein